MQERFSRDDLRTSTLVARTLQAAHDPAHNGPARRCRGLDSRPTAPPRAGRAVDCPPFSSVTPGDPPMKLLLSLCAAAALCAPASAQQSGMINRNAPTITQTVTAGAAKISLNYTSIAWGRGEAF